MDLAAQVTKVVAPSALHKDINGTTVRFIDTVVEGGEITWQKGCATVLTLR